MKLSDAELEIMEKVWELGAPVTAAQLTERMAEKGWKPSTLLTFLARMVNKGALAVEKQGKQNLYRALVSAEDYRAQAARELLGRAAMVENCGLPGERVFSSLKEKPESSGYFTTIILL